MLVSRVHKYRNRNSMDYVSVPIEANLGLRWPCEKGVYMTTNNSSCVELWYRCSLTQEYEVRIKSPLNECDAYTYPQG